MKDISLKFPMPFVAEVSDYSHNDIDELTRYFHCRLEQIGHKWYLAIYGFKGFVYESRTV